MKITLSIIAMLFSAVISNAAYAIDQCTSEVKSGDFNPKSAICIDGGNTNQQLPVSALNYSCTGSTDDDLYICDGTLHQLSPIVGAASFTYDYNDPEETSVKFTYLLFSAPGCQINVIPDKPEVGTIFTCNNGTMKKCKYNPNGDPIC